MSKKCQSELAHHLGPDRSWDKMSGHPSGRRCGIGKMSELARGLGTAAARIQTNVTARPRRGRAGGRPPWPSQRGLPAWSAWPARGRRAGPSPFARSSRQGPTHLRATGQPCMEEKPAGPVRQAEPPAWPKAAPGQAAPQLVRRSAELHQAAQPDSTHPAEPYSTLHGLAPCPSPANSAHAPRPIQPSPIGPGRQAQPSCLAHTKSVFCRAYIRWPPWGTQR